jgi:hypothetical protein
MKQGDVGTSSETLGQFAARAFMLAANSQQNASVNRQQADEEWRRQ